MVQTKKINSEAFGDILAGLETGAPTISPGAPLSIDMSWVESLRTEPVRNAPEQQTEPAASGRSSDPAHQLRRNLGSWGWRRKGLAARASPSAEVYAQEAANFSEQPEEASANARANPSNIAPASFEPEAGLAPLHIWRRLLGRIPWRWRSGDGRSPADEAPAAAMENAAGATLAAFLTPTAPKSETEAIAEELGLSADLAIVDLRRIRRDFAKRNHPDRFGPALRVGAARRMTIANMLIDEHLKAKPPAH